MEYTFQIPIRPQVKQRPRFNGHAYTPKKTREFEKILSVYFSKIKRPISFALEIEIDFVFQKPKRAAKSYPSKGDLDNYAKAVLDSMNKRVFEDDSQITKLTCSKKFGESDLICVKVTRINDA